MGITVISEDNLHEYMQILTSDEIFGINEDTLTSFVISDDEKNEPAGVLTVQIFPEFRHRGYAARLLDIIKDRPGTLLKLSGKHSQHEHFFDYGDL